MNPPRVVGIAPRDDESCPLQSTEMMGHQVRGEPERICKFAVAALTIKQRVEDAEPVGVCQYRQALRQRVPINLPTASSHLIRPT